MSDQDALTPKLTAEDERLLAIVPVVGLRAFDCGLSAWEIAEVLETEDVRTVRQTLDGLVHHGHCLKSLRTRRVHAYYRTSSQVLDDLSALGQEQDQLEMTTEATTPQNHNAGPAPEEGT